MTGKKIKAYDRLLAEASAKYDLPDYGQERYRDFVVNMHNKGYEVRDYHGRFYYRGPAVVVEPDLVQKAMRDAGMDCVTDNMAFDYIVYPKG